MQEQPRSRARVQRSLSQSIFIYFRGLAALGFAVSILLGNFWVIYRIFANNVPNEVTYGATICLGAIIVGGFGMGISSLVGIWDGRK